MSLRALAPLLALTDGSNAKFIVDPSCVRNILILLFLYSIDKFYLYVDDQILKCGPTKVLKWLLFIYLFIVCRLIFMVG